MSIIYFDSASTSFPKNTKILRQVFKKYIEEPFGDTYRQNSTINVVEDTRLAVENLLTSDGQYTILFSPGATYSINTILKSEIYTNKRIVTTNIEHNAVYRVLYYLKQKFNIDYCIVEYMDKNYNFYPERILDASETLKTDVIIMNHVSNVTGLISDIYTISKNKPINTKIIIDGTQAVGIIPVNLSNSNIDYYIGTSHKHLQSIPGVGFTAIKKKLSCNIIPLAHGGTGISSAIMKQTWDDATPNIIESGTYNLLSLSALHECINDIDTNEKLYRIQKILLPYLYNNLKTIKDIKIFTKKENNTGIVLINVKDFSPEYIINPFLATNNIVSRSGLHCAPEIHKTLGTFPNGGLRLSLSEYNSIEEIDILCNLLERLSNE